MQLWRRHAIVPSRENAALSCSSRPVGGSNVGGAFVPRKNVAAQRRLPPSFRTAKRLQKKAVQQSPSLVYSNRPRSGRSTFLPGSQLSTLNSQHPPPTLPFRNLANI